MGFYARHVLPRLIELGCGSEVARRQRDRVVPLARGEVLEIGFGSGLNLEHYDPDRVASLWALEPAAEMLALARPRIERFPRPVTVLQTGAEAIPLPAASVETVLVTFTLCTIPSPERALAEMRRVLRPTGRLLFCEHGASPDSKVRRWQNRLTPLWRRCAGGCHLNRPILELLAAADFVATGAEQAYLPGWRPATWCTWGTAELTAP